MKKNYLRRNEDQKLCLKTTTIKIRANKQTYGHSFVLSYFFVNHFMPYLLWIKIRFIF